MNRNIPLAVVEVVGRNVPRRAQGLPRPVPDRRVLAAREPNQNNVATIQPSVTRTSIQVKVLGRWYLAPDGAIPQGLLVYPQPFCEFYGADGTPGWSPDGEQLAEELVGCRQGGSAGHDGSRLAAPGRSTRNFPLTKHTV